MERQRARSLDHIHRQTPFGPNGRSIPPETVECFGSSALGVADKGADDALLAAMTVALSQRRILRLPKPGFGCVPEWTACIAGVDRQRRAIALHRRNHRTAFAGALAESRRLRLIRANKINSKPVSPADADGERAGRLRPCYPDNQKSTRN